MLQDVDKGQILVVEDENIVAMDIRQSLQRLGYSVPAVVATAEDALVAAERWRPDLILMDIRLRGETDGIQAATQIRDDYRLPVVYLTAFADASTLERAKTTEPFGYILKPFEDRELNSTIEMALYRHKIEKQLQENERWLETVLRSIGDAVLTVDLVGRISFMNRVAEQLSGYRWEEVQGKFFDKLMQISSADEKDGRPVSVLQPRSDTLRVRTFQEKWLRTPHQEPLPIDCTLAPLIDEDGQIGVVVVFRDISRRLQAESALRASEQRYRELFAQAEVALLTSELHNQINRSLMTSASMRDLLQAIVDGMAEILPKSQILLHPVNQRTGQLETAVRNHARTFLNPTEEIKPGEQWPHLVESVTQERRPLFLQRNEEGVVSIHVSMKSESILAAAAWTHFFRHPSNMTIETAAVVPLIYRDKTLGILTAISIHPHPPITERELEMIIVIASQSAVAMENVRLLEEVERENRELIRSNAELEDFAVVASHDMQEPLRTIRGFAQILEEQQRGQDDHTDEILDYIVSGVETMEQLLKNLMDYAQVGAAGREWSTASLQGALDRALATLLPTIIETQAQITHDPLPVVHADHTQLCQVLQNLLSNALKFRDATPPRIHIGVAPVEGGHHFSVQDNGVGIGPEATQDDVFAPFRRLHSRSEYSGTGIGLTICKKIIEAHGGRIWFESAPGKGTTFHFTISN